MAFQLKLDLQGHVNTMIYIIIISQIGEKIKNEKEKQAL